jgi:hypothetical protein
VAIVMRSGERHPTGKMRPGTVPLRRTICSAEYQRSMVEAPKRTSSPVNGWRQVRAASSLKAACKSPGAGGAASNGPMIAKRSRAHRSRRSGSSSQLTDRLPTAATPAVLLWRAGYEALVRPATGIFCGSAAARSPPSIYLIMEAVLRGQTKRNSCISRS